MKRLLPVLLAVSSLYAGEPVAVTKENAMTFYREFQRLTKEPKYVAPKTSLLCRPPLPAELKKDEAFVKAHGAAYVHVYANPVASEVITAGGKEFPEGAVIVKEKLGDKKEVTDIGGMIKRAKGYDSANGDWEYFFRSQAGELTSGKMANCASCHNAAPKGQVYSVWALKK